MNRTLASLLLAASIASADDLTLVRDGKAGAVILPAKDARRLGISGIAEGESLEAREKEMRKREK